MSGVLGNALVARDHQRSALGISLAALGLNLALNVALVPSRGIAAAAWIALGCEGVIFVAASLLVARRLGLRAAPRVLARAVPACGVMAAALWPLRDAPLWASVPTATLVFVLAAWSFGVVSHLRARAVAAAWL